MLLSLCSSFYISKLRWLLEVILQQFTILRASPNIYVFGSALNPGSTPIIPKPNIAYRSLSSHDMSPNGYIPWVPKSSVPTNASLSMQGGYRALFAEGKSRLKGTEPTTTSPANSEEHSTTRPTSKAVENPETGTWTQTGTISIVRNDTPTKVTLFSKEMHPEGYLDFTSKRNNKALASLEEISPDTVASRIVDAAHYVAARDHKPLMAVLSDLEKDRLKHGVHRSHKEYVAALNRRAAGRFKSSGVKRPSRSVACKVRAGRQPPVCKKHAFCSLMHLEDSTKAAHDAEKEAEKASELADCASG